MILSDIRTDLNLTNFIYGQFSVDQTAKWRNYQADRPLVFLHFKNVFVSGKKIC